MSYTKGGDGGNCPDEIADEASAYGGQVSSRWDSERHIPQGRRVGIVMKIGAYSYMSLLFDIIFYYFGITGLNQM